MKVICHNGITYSIEERRADVGELVLVTALDKRFENQGVKVGDILPCSDVWRLPLVHPDDRSIYVQVAEIEELLLDTQHTEDDYRVLVPRTDVMTTSSVIVEIPNE